MQSTKTDGWRNVSAESPCPICGKSDWCSVSNDGATAACRRVADGAAENRTDKSGAPFHVHRLNDAANRPGHGYIHPGHLRRAPANGAAVEKPKAAGAVEAANADTLHKAYAFILSELKLSSEHRQALHKRGLSDEEIGRRGYRSYPFNVRNKIAENVKLVMLVKAAGYALKNIPGYLPRNDDRKSAALAGAEGLLVPCRDSGGRIVALKVRRDSAADWQSKYCYVSSAKHGGPGPGAPPHVPLGVAGPVEFVRLTEGELKADVATALSGVATIGAGAGVASWRACLPVLRELGAKTVRVAFDADARTNKTVAAALVSCVEALPGEGFAVELERWPDQYKGIDDALAAGAATEVLAGDAALAAAREIAAAAGVHATGPATKMITVDAIGELALTVEAAAGSKPQRTVSAKIGDVRHTDRLDVSSAARRKQFARALADKLKAPASADAILAALDSTLPELAETADKNASKSATGGSGDGEKSQATILAEIAAEWELWHTAAGDCYATIPVGEHAEHWPVRSREFKRHLSKAFWETEDKAANSEALGAALNVAEAMAAHDGEEYPVAIRVAERDGSIFVDLCDKN